MANAQSDLDAGDEARHTGDRLGFPHNVSDGTAVDSASPAIGKLVTYDGTDIAAVTGDNSDSVAGVLFTYQVYGESNNGPYVRGDRDATVGVRGSYVADLTEHSNNAGVTVGEHLGADNKVYVKNAINASNNIYEVVIR